MSGYERIVILTGAGLSAESGLSTFRDKDGIWSKHRIEDVATPEAFARDPESVLEFYNTRRKGATGVKPNAAHEALARLETVVGQCHSFPLCQGENHLGQRVVVVLYGKGGLSLNTVQIIIYTGVFPDKKRGRYSLKAQLPGQLMLEKVLYELDGRFGFPQR